MGKSSLVLLLAFLLTSCGSDSGGTTEPDPEVPVPTTVLVSPASVTLDALGATAQLTAEVKDQRGRTMNGAAVSWSSDNQAILTVNASSGVATAVAVGSTTVRATSGSASASASVVVRQVPTQLDVLLAADHVAPGGTTQASVTAQDAQGHAIASPAVTWSSSDTVVASVDAAGLVSARAAGVAHIRGAAGSLADSLLLSVALSLQGEQISLTTNARGEAAVFSGLGGGTHFQFFVQDPEGRPLAGATVDYGEVGGKAIIAVRGPGGLYAPAFLFGSPDSLRAAAGLPVAVASHGGPDGAGSEAGPDRAVSDVIRIRITLPTLTASQQAVIQKAFRLKTFFFESGVVDLGLDGVFRGRKCMTWAEFAQMQRDRLDSIPGWKDAVLRLIRDSAPSYFDPAPVSGTADLWFSTQEVVDFLTGGDLLAEKVALLGQMLLEGGPSGRRVEVDWEFGDSGPPIRHSLGVFRVRTNDPLCGGALATTIQAIQDPVVGAPGGTVTAGARVLNRFEEPVPGVEVTFTLGSGQGELPGGILTAKAVTDSLGRATVAWTLPGAAGTYQLIAALPPTPGETPQATIRGIAQTQTALVPTEGALSAGNTHTCGLTPDGIAWCWGRNANGELGNGAGGTGAYQASPDSVHNPPGTLFLAVFSGDEHTCGLTTDSAAYCWGRNEFGQVGNGATAFVVSDPTVVSVPAGLKFKTLAPGGTHTCGLTTAGAAYCWGRNNRGQLGDGLSDDRPTPAPVAGSLTFTDLKAGGLHTCGLTAAGGVHCWGDNTYSQLGSTGQNPQRVPAAVPGAPALASLAAGNYHTCGLTAAGAGYCWGRNHVGQIGNGATAPFLATPTMVLQGPFSRLAAGGNHTCAVKADSIPRCWGWNNDGQLGDGTTVSRHTPTPVAGGHAFRILSVGAFHTCGLTPTGVAWCWGDDTHFQLGNGVAQSLDQLAPVAVEGGHLFGRPAAVPAPQRTTPRRR